MLSGAKWPGVGTARWPAGVRAVDFGIRGLDLAYAMLDGHDLTILIDATLRGGSPGTLYVIEPDLSGLDGEAQGAGLMDAHTLDPLKILGLARAGRNVEATALGWVRAGMRRGGPSA